MTMLGCSVFLLAAVLAAATPAFAGSAKATLSVSATVTPNCAVSTAAGGTATVTLRCTRGTAQPALGTSVSGTSESSPHALAAPASSAAPRVADGLRPLTHAPSAPAAGLLWRPAGLGRSTAEAPVTTGLVPVQRELAIDGDTETFTITLNF
jgi:hypothetical protein